jgi:hypothetical protein
VVLRHDTEDMSKASMDTQRGTYGCRVFVLDICEYGGLHVLPSYGMGCEKPGLNALLHVWICAVVSLINSGMSLFRQQNCEIKNDGKVRIIYLFHYRNAPA